MQTPMSQAKAFIRDTEGASTVEYGLLIAGIVATVMAAIYAIGTALNTKFTSVQTKLG